MNGGVSAAYGPRGPCSTTLSDVLSTCRTAAQIIGCELLSGCLHKKKLSSPRLACKELKQAIDSQISKLKLTLRSIGQQCWADRQLPSLSGFTACRSLHMHIVLDSRSDSDSLTALVDLPFLSSELHSRQRIEDLVLTVSGVAGDQMLSGHCCGETAAAMLTTKLPNLRYLDLQRMPMSYDSILQQQMFKALAGLHYLQQLVLPSVRALDNVAGLADSNSLTTICIGSGDGSFLSPKSIEGISRLQRLKNLRINSCAFDLTEAHENPAADASRVQHLLTRLPISVERLSFDVRLGGSEYCLDFTLRDGLLHGIEIFMATLILPAQAVSFSGLLGLLLQAGQWGSSKPVISMREATIYMEEPLLGSGAEHFVTQLLGCQLEASNITATSWHLAMEAMRLASGIPRFLTLTNTGLKLGPFSSDEQRQQQIQVPRHPRAVQLQPTISISTPQLAQMVVHLLCNPNVNPQVLLAAAQTRAGSDDKGIAATAEVHSTQQVMVRDVDDSPAPSELLLLHGYLISKLVAASPSSLACWLRGLGKEAAQAAGLGDAFGQLFKSYLVLPAPTAAVLVECCAEVENVRVVVDGVCRTLAAVMSLDALQVSAVAVKPCSGGCDGEDAEWVDLAYQGAFKQVLMKVWEHLTGRFEDDPGQLRKVLIYLLEAAAPLGEDLEWGEL